MGLGRGGLGKAHEMIPSCITSRVWGSPTPLIGLSAGKTPGSPSSHGLYRAIAKHNGGVAARAKGPGFHLS
jgi:hypothetical protein